MNKENILKLLDCLGKKYYLNKTKPFVMTQCFFSWNHKHGDKVPSFGIKIEDYDHSTCKCYTCHRDIVKLYDVMDEVNDRSNYKYQKLLEFVIENDKSDLKLKFKKVFNNKKKQVIDEQVFDEDELNYFNKEYHPYFKERDLSEETVDFWGLKVDYKKDRIVFPLRRSSDKKLVGILGRSISNYSKPKYFNYWNFQKSKYFFGEQLFNSSVEKNIIVEGPIDVIHAQQIFCDTSKYLFLGTMGADMSSVQSLRLIKSGKPTILMYDNDAAGKKATEIAKIYLKKHIKVYVARLPSGLDPGDKRFNLDIAEDIIESARFVL